jgi:membrane associated rhomboid family serine protease
VLTVATLVSLLIVGAVIYRIMSPDARTRAFQTSVQAAKELHEYKRQELEPFWQTLRSRTRWPIVTIALAAINVSMYLRMLFGAGSLSDPATLIAWGASVGPHSTNGEWWRLVTAMFINAGFFAIVISTAALVQVGVLLERFVGPLAFSSAYLAAGVLAGLVSLSLYPLAVNAGASAAVFGVFGLLAAAFMYASWRRAEMTIPLAAMHRLAPMTALFVLYAIFSANVGLVADAVGFLVGLLLGVVVLKENDGQVPAPRRVGTVAVAAAVVAVVAAIPLRGIADLGPEIERLAGVEQRTMAVYEPAHTRLQKRKTTGKELAGVIETTIIPSSRRPTSAFGRFAVCRGKTRRGWRMPASICDCASKAGSSGRAACERSGYPCVKSRADRATPKRAFGFALRRATGRRNKRCRLPKAGNTMRCSCSIV